MGLVAISSASSTAVGGPIRASTSMEPSYMNGTATISHQTKVVADSKRVNEAKEIIKSADIVCFDVDSTVIKEEGIDELAEFCGKGQEVSNL